MITGKTRSGFEFSIPKKVFHSMKVNRMIANMGEGSGAKETLDILDVLMGKEQTERFLDHCDEVATDDKFGDSICMEGVNDIFTALNEDSDVKNS